MPRPLLALALFCLSTIALAGGDAVALGKKLAAVPKLTDANLKAVTDADESVRKELFQHYDDFKFKDDNRVALCDFVLRKDPSEEVRVAAAGWLGRMQNNKFGVKILAEHLSDKSPPMRKAACEGLIGYRGDPTLGPRYAKLIFDDSLDVRQAALRALGKFGDRKQVPTIVGAYKKLKKNNDDDAFFGEALALLGETDISLDIARVSIKSRSFAARLASMNAIECNPSMKTLPIIMDNLALELRRTVSLDSSKKEWDIVYTTMCGELVKRTGKNLGNDCIGWHTWWEGVREKYKAPAPAFDETLVSRWMESYLKMGPSKVKE